MPYALYSTDGRGDSGPMSDCITRDGIKTRHPRVGGCMMVGSPYARTYQAQDYWRTSEIMEIISKSKDEVVFRTRTGSIYTWSEF